MPLNCASEAPLVVKNVAAVPSGPTKLNGPLTLLLPATWNCKLVPAGMSAFHDNVVQVVLPPAYGLPSKIPDVRVPDGGNPVFTNALKPRSRPPDVTSATHV